VTFLAYGLLDAALGEEAVTVTPLVFSATGTGVCTMRFELRWADGRFMASIAAADLAAAATGDGFLQKEST